MRQDLRRQGEGNHDRLTTMDIHYFDSLESTNKYCKLLDLNNVGEFTVICARNQTGGIGQKGNSWISEPFKNLTFSLVLKPIFLHAEYQYSLTMTLAVAVADAIALLMPRRKVSIKWPNDIYVNDKKICGILTTVSVSGGLLSHAICGIGINVNQTDFPEWVPNPTSLSAQTGQTFVIDEVLNLVLRQIQSAYDLLRHSPASIRDSYMSRLYRLGQQSKYLYKGETITATITDITGFGHLVLRGADGTMISCDLKEIAYL